MADLLRREPDAIHVRLKAAVEVEITTYLWVPNDTPPFTPALHPMIYGDGRALFWFTTINQRPRYWVIRGDSNWSLNEADAPDDAPNFGELLDEGGIIDDLEERFGRSRCGYCGVGLFAFADSPDEAHCGDDNCQAPEDVQDWPAVDDYDGSSWGRKKWPLGFDIVKHPFACANLLASPDPEHKDGR